MARRHAHTAYALCVNNDGYPAALELRKLYQIVSPEPNDPEGWLRIIDESGEDYLYNGERFRLLTLPSDVRQVVEATF
jgi:hypothetical protein